MVLIFWLNMRVVVCKVSTYIENVCTGSARRSVKIMRIEASFSCLYFGVNHAVWRIICCTSERSGFCWIMQIDSTAPFLILRFFVLQRTFFLYCDLLLIRRKRQDKPIFARLSNKKNLCKHFRSWGTYLKCVYAQNSHGYSQNEVGVFPSSFI